MFFLGMLSIQCKIGDRLVHWTLGNMGNKHSA